MIAPYTIFNTTDDLFVFLATELKRYSECAEIQHISLSGGSTPKGLFRFITRSEFKDSITWPNLHFWWGDERCVSFSDPQSNYGEAKALLFDHVDIPQSNLHIMPVDTFNPLKISNSAAQRYSNEMLEYLPQINNYPKFDWILLGVGEDGHTASLFPNMTNLDTESPTLLVLKPNTNEYRLSLSAHTLRAAKRISYLITGQSKAEVVAEIILKRGQFSSYPAYLIRAESGQTEYLLDTDASSLLINKK